jgi:hypothetical protein
MRGQTMELAQVQEQNVEIQKMESTRQNPRYPVSLSVVFEPGASLSAQKPQPEEVAGNTHNLSEGGLCISTDQALKESQIIRIRLPIANGCATMPTLAEVRWVKRQQVRASSARSGGNRYTAGLRFLF